MKTKKELDKLSHAIGAAERKYYNAVRENLKESGKEHGVQSDYEDEDDWDDVVGLHVTTTDRHNNNVMAVIDKVCFNPNDGVDGLVEVHVCEWDYVKKDYWIDIQMFDDSVLSYVYDNIIW